MSLSKFGNFISEQFDNLTGGSAADAAEEAARLQVNAANEARAQQQEAAAPFIEFGESFIPITQQAISETQSLFSPGARQGVIEDPAFASISDRIINQLLRRQAAGGRVNSGETPEILQSGLIAESGNILNQERNAALSRNQQLLQALGIGQATSTNNAAQITDLITGAAAAQGAGIIGAANAGAKGTQNLVGLGVGAATGGFNPFATQGV